MEFCWAKCQSKSPITTHTCNVEDSPGGCTVRAVQMLGMLPPFPHVLFSPSWGQHFCPDFIIIPPAANGMITSEDAWTSSFVSNLLSLAALSLSLPTPCEEQDQQSIYWAPPCFVECLDAAIYKFSPICLSLKSWQGVCACVCIFLSLFLWRTEEHWRLKHRLYIYIGWWSWDGHGERDNGEEGEDRRSEAVQQIEGASPEMDAWSPSLLCSCHSQAWRPAQYVLQTFSLFLFWSRSIYVFCCHFSFFSFCRSGSD